MGIKWVEDDCTTNDPEHDTLEKAFKRLSGREFDALEDGAEHDDRGDGTHITFADGIEVFCSYPGNSHIWLPDCVKYQALDPS